MTPSPTPAVLPDARAIDLTPWGYAPGSYVFTCVDCPKEMDLYDRMGRLGAKRSWRCEEHALAARLATPPASDAAVPAGEDEGEDEHPLTAEEQAMIDAAWERHKAARPCTIPPEGWRCTRTGGHDGPCAAVAAAPKVASDTGAGFVLVPRIATRKMVDAADACPDAYSAYAAMVEAGHVR